jgi:hypothetical protein
MARAHSRRPRRLRREALVFQHLERVSRKLLEDHPDIVRQFIGRNAGVYALYRKNKLYYVGLAKGLRSRLTAHGRNRHGKRWDHFSIYLTIKDQHLREIEALLLRITQPEGAKQSGKLAQSKDMKRQIMRAIRVKQRRQVTSLFAKYAIGKDRADGDGVESDLMHYLPNGARLRGFHRGKVHKARARRNGTIQYNGRNYSSLSLAATAAVKRHVNGWWFWQVERGRGNWIRLTQIRRTGTPFYGR